jgi:HSP20 family protein
MARDRSKNQEEPRSLEPRRQAQISRDMWSMPSPFGMMRRFADEMDRMFEGFGFPAGMGHLRPWKWSEQFSPQVDIVERDGKLVIRADMPGMTRENVNVDITDEAVVIEGERKYEHEENEEGIHRSERSYGHFHREIPLPEGVKSETATANFRNGVLEITIEAPQTRKNRRRIEIEGEKSGGGKAA